MKKSYGLLGGLLTLFFLAASFYFISRSIAESKQFKEEKKKVAEILNINDRIFSFRDWVFSEEAWQEKKAEFEIVLQKADKHYANALRYGYYLLIGCLIYLILLLLIYLKKRKYFGITFALSFIGLSLLVQGITNPILEIAAFKDDLTIKIYVKAKDIPYFEEAIDYMGKISDIADYIKYVPIVGDDWADGAKELVGEGQAYLQEHSNDKIGKDQVFTGRTYFYYQNKGISDVISLLWHNSNKPVALAIAVFSVVIPAIKLLFTLLMLILPITELKRLRKFLMFIAKWSMADVFVVSLFLAFLSFANMSPGVETDASILFGLYYFAGYVFISILLGFLLNKSIDEKKAFNASQVSNMVE